VSANPTQIRRPRKWDQAFSADLDETEISAVLEQEPFKSMLQEKTSSSSGAKNKIFDILKNEARVTDFKPEELIVRQGDYGATAYFIISGEVQVLFNVDDKLLGRSSNQNKGIISHIARVLKKSDMPETRDPSSYDLSSNEEHKLDKAIYLQDLPNIIRSQKDKPHTMRSGEIFGEIGALSRSIRSATIVASKPTKLLELKWQGLRDLMRASKSFAKQIDDTYRARSLRSLLLSMEAFRDIPEQDLEALVTGAEFASFGRRDWNTKTGEETPICKQGDVSSSLIVMRSGFAKLTSKMGSGEFTRTYISKGELFGLQEVKALSTYKHNLYALGYTDVIMLPGSLCQTHLFPYLDDKKINEEVKNLSDDDTLQNNDPKQGALLDFFVSERFINGTETMLINMDRCTGCDDCVRACSDNHDNNPRFIRHGKQFDNFMVANACMHCADPVCMIGCPTGAIHRIPSGEVIINDTTCIGCQTCANSCPYGNIRMVEIKDKNGALILDEDMKPINKATKCDLCYDNPVSPACQNACPHDALRRVNLADNDSIKDWLDK
jgi:Fe-S-cluster-containing dehydrogenase component/CRP-like cAMP-binding protein